MKQFTKHNISKIPKNRTGTYNLYDNNKHILYSGSSKRIRHRLQSYYQKDDLKEHPTKRTLRAKIKYYKIQLAKKKLARLLEKRRKANNPYNHG